MRKIFAYYLLALSLAPFIAFAFREIADVYFFWAFGSVGTLLAVAYFIGLNGRPKFPAYLIPFIGFVIVKAVWDSIHGVVAETGGTVGYLYRNIYLHSISLLFIIANSDFTQKEYKLLINILKGTVIVAFLFSVIQVVHDPFFFSPAASERYMGRSIFNIRLNSCFGYLGSNAVGLSFIPVLAIVYSHSIKNNDKYLVLWIILGALVCILTNSRYVQLNFAIICLLFVVHGKMSIYSYGFSMIGMVMLIYIFFMIVGFDVISYINERLLDDSASTRILAWQLFKEYFPNQPYFGTGDNLTDEIVRALRGRSSQIHVGYLSHLYTYGIIGCLMLFSFWYALTKEMYDKGKASNFYGGFFAMVGFLVANLTLVDDSIFRYGIIISVLVAKYEFDHRKQIKTSPNE